MSAIYHLVTEPELWAGLGADGYRPATRWERIGRNMPSEIGDIGFGIVLHPRDPDTAWVFPMDGTTVWPRTSIDGKPALYCTRDGGASWQRQDRGLPREQAWYTVKRQAFCGDDCEPMGLYFGTTSGEVWASAVHRWASGCAGDAVRDGEVRGDLPGGCWPAASGWTVHPETEGDGEGPSDAAEHFRVAGVGVGAAG